MSQPSRKQQSKESPVHLYRPPTTTETGDSDSSPSTPQSQGRKRLRQIYLHHLLPKLQHISDATRESYLTLLNHWERLTGDPPSDEISSAMIFQFRADLQAEPKARDGEKRSSATINKNMRVLHPLISLLMPRDREHPSALGVIDYIEYPEALPEDDPIPRVLTHAELDLLYEYAAAARWPSERYTGIPTELWWQTTAVGLRNCGARVFDFFDLGRDELDALIDAVDSLQGGSGLFRKLAKR